MLPNILPPDDNFLGLDAGRSEWDASATIILPLALERTASYGRGTQHGPEALLRASQQVELFDEETGVDASRRGIATLPIETFAGLDAPAVIEKIDTMTTAILVDRKFPVALGGEHTITAGTVAAFARRDIDFSVLQLDAHSDLRDTYDGSPWSHACVMRRVHDLGVHHVGAGIRSQCEEERAWANNADCRLFYAHDLQKTPDWDAVIDALHERVYLTIDVDVFDPAVMPATGTPEPGGLHWGEMLDLLRRLAERRTIIGLDIVELAPIPALHHPDFTAARLLYKILGYIQAPSIKEGTAL